MRKAACYLVRKWLKDRAFIQSIRKSSARAQTRIRADTQGSAMKKSTSTVAALAAVLIFAASGAQGQEFVRIVSGSAGGAWYPLGAKIAEVFQQAVKDSKIAVRNGPGGGGSNPRKVDSGEAEIGFTAGYTAADAFNGRGAYKKEHKNLCAFASLFPGVLQVVVPKNSKIRSFRDLKAASISPGKVFTSGNVALSRLLGLYGLTYDSIKKNGGAIHRISYSDALAMMKDGHVDAFAALTSVPFAPFLAADFSPGIRILEVEKDIREKFIKTYPGFWIEQVPTGVYKSVTEPVTAIASATILVIHKNVPEKTAYNLSAAFWSNHGEMLKVNKDWERVELKTALRGIDIPVHPGVERFLREKGVVN